MPNVKIESQSDLSPQEAYSRVKGLLQSDSELKSYDPQFNVEFNDSALSGAAKGGLFSADLSVSSDAGGGSSVLIDLDLPAKLALAKGLIRRKLQNKLDQCLS